MWVTWLTKLMIGENGCEWSPWFKAHYDSCSWEKADRNFGQSHQMAQTLMKHTALISSVRSERESNSSCVFTEKQNSFRLIGKTATLGGKPDIISLRNGDDGQVCGTVIDVKTGKPSPSHVAQVMVYMYAVPKALGQYRGVCFDGQVVYPDHHLDIPAEALDPEFVTNMGALLRRIGGEEPAVRAPSLAECRFCDITSADCPGRMDEGAEDEGETNDF